MDENIKLLIKYDFENGVGVTDLSKKYKTSANTINSWKKREKWQKKVAPKGSAPNSKKRTKNKIGANEKNIQIQKDFLEGKTKEEIMQKHAIAERTYYEKVKNARQLRKEKTEKYLDTIIDEVYPDLQVLLKNIEISKRNLTIRSTNEIKKNDADVKKILENKKVYDVIKAMGNDLIRTGKMLTPYELLEIDQQLSNEELQLEKIEVEKSKNKINNEDTKIEIELIEV